MLKFDYKQTIRERITAKCPKHPRYNPEKEGGGRIKGACSTCYSLHDLHQVRLKLDAAIHEFIRRAGPWVRSTRTPEAEDHRGVASTRRSPGGSAVSHLWSDYFTALSTRKVGTAGWKTSKADETMWKGHFEGRLLCVVSTVRLSGSNMAHFLVNSGARIGENGWNLYGGPLCGPPHTHDRPAHRRRAEAHWGADQD